MSKNKLTITAVNQTRIAAAEAVSRANGHLEALKERINRDIELAVALQGLLSTIRSVVRDGDKGIEFVVHGKFADALLPTAQSYGFTFIEHETLKNVLVVVKEQAE